ncbi:L-asparagine oxygenase [Embleya hyalina]|uniref:L-asparagine oxygenase n=2 Tax=Embleya hyalina TaxID=516124 RepID=A0A401Z701_9ACTN|nr:L-asparagine oxygenase [Embleya hyalina]
MHQVSLSARDVDDVFAVVDELAGRFPGVEDEAFLDEAAVFAHELPRALRSALNTMRLGEPAGAMLVSGFPVDDVAIGRTPVYRGRQEAAGVTRREEMFFFLCGALLGDAIGWATQQDARLMHDVLPIPGHENVQLNSASEMEIWWHVEDAFHPYRADYVGLMCLRNHDGVPTTYAALGEPPLPAETVEVLFQPRFLIRPDNSHLAARAGDGPPGGEARVVPAMPIAVLFGDRAAPYLRPDPYFMEPTPDDPRAQEAFALLTARLDANLRGVPLRPGEVLFVDNYLAVHGRRPFRARYDGRDRWLKRLNITRDLRKSRDARSSPASRVLGTFGAVDQERRRPSWTTQTSTGA